MRRRLPGLIPPVKEFRGAVAEEKQAAVHQRDLAKRLSEELAGHREDGWPYADDLVEALDGAGLRLVEIEP
jgi:hypothetical protein